LHHRCTLAGILIGAQQRRPCSSFTSTLSTPIFDKTSRPPPHAPNSFTFKRVKTRLAQSLFRVQTQITHPLSRAQARLAPQGFSSCPRALRPSRLTPSRVLWVDTTYRALPHPGFVPCPIPDLCFYITYLLRYNTTQRVFSPGAGFNPPEFFFLLFFSAPCDLPVSCCPATSVVRSRSTS